MPSSSGSSSPSTLWPPSCSGETDPFSTHSLTSEGQTQVNQANWGLRGDGENRATPRLEPCFSTIFIQRWLFHWLNSGPLLCSFLVSVIYSKAKLASACGGIIYFLSYVPYMYVAIREEVAHDKITAFEKCIAVRSHSSFVRASCGVTTVTYHCCSSAVSHVHHGLWPWLQVLCAV